LQDEINRGSTAIGAAGDVLGTLPAGNNADVGAFKNEGPVWWVGLDEPQTVTLDAVLAAGGQALALAAFPLWPAVSAALGASVAYIKFVDKLGGNNGVDINGVIGTAGVIVTPRLGAIYGDLLQAARVAVSGRTILDFVVQASGAVPGLGAALDVPVVAAIFQAAAAGTPLGWAIAGAVGLVVDLLGSSTPDPNAHGAVVADRDQAQAWESFLMGSLGDTQHFSLLSWQGFFSAQQGGGGRIYANRPEIGEWETWTLVDNFDGTVSFKFHVDNLPNGKVCLRTLDHNKFVSVQQNS
jgi:hypothetical protein